MTERGDKKLANDFNIILGAKIDTASLTKNINDYFSQNTFKIKVEIDTAKMQSQIQSAVSSAMSKTTGGSSDTATGEAVDFNDKTITSITTKLNAEGKAVGYVVEKMKDLNGVTRIYANETGKLTSSVEKSTTGVKANLQATAKVESAYDKVSSRIKDLTKQNLIGKDAAKGFKEQLDKAYSMKDTDPKQAAADIQKVNQAISDGKKQAMGFGKMLSTAYKKFANHQIATSYRNVC